MANVKVSDSVVYRSWHTRPTQRRAVVSPDTLREQHEPGSDVSKHTDSKWTFLQRLLAIEEAHDKRRAAEDMIRKSSKEEIRRSDEMHRDENINPTSSRDTQYQWTYGQILDDSRCTPDGRKSPDNESRTSLPPISLTKTTSDPYLNAAPYIDTGSHQTKLPKLPDNVSTRSSIQMTQSQSNLHSSNSNLSKLGTSRQPSFVAEDVQSGSRSKRKRPLRLPPILLPRVYTIKPRPLQCREFLTPTKVRGPITDSEWDELKDCRYIRHALPRYSLQVSSSNLTFQS